MSCGPLSFICSALGTAVSSVASTGFDAIAQSFGEAASTLCEWMWSAISDTSTVDLTGSWFDSDLAITAELASVLVAALFVLQLIKGALSRDPGALGRAVTGAGTAFIGAAAAIAVTQTLLVLTDDLSDGIAQTLGLGDLTEMGKKLTPVALLAGSGFTPALIIVLSVFFLIASVLVWAVFIMRKAMIIVAAVFAPVAFGGAASDSTRSWVRKWIEFTISMIFSKLIVVLIFTIAVSLIGQSTPDTTGLSNLMTGLLMLVLACFAPWMVFKMVHFIGGDMIAAHQTGMMKDTKAAAGTPSAMGSMARNTAQKTFASPGGGSSAGSGEATAAASSAVPVAAVAASRASSSRDDEGSKASLATASGSSGASSPEQARATGSSTTPASDKPEAAA